MLAAIIQARMESERLPGKSMMDICGKPMLQHVIERVKQAVQNIYIVTPADSSEIIEFAKENNIPYSLDRKPRDVLDSFYHCAERYGITKIVRVCADNPLIDPEMIRKVVSLEGYDYVSPNPRVLGNWCEAFSFEVLEKAQNQATEPYDREHVTPYIYHHPEIFKLGTVEIENKPSITVDTMEDLCEVIRRLS